MNVLVTGSSGFIGSYLVAALREDGHRVVGIDRERPAWCEPDQFVHADLLEDGPLARALRDVECVFHLAAAKDDWGISRDEYFRDNADATEKLLSVGAEKGVGRWVHYSTVGVLPGGGEPRDESTPVDPDTDYGASKAAAERAVSRHARSRPDDRVVVLRPSAVFGPRNPPTTNVHRLIEAIRSDRFLMVGEGDTPKTTSYIENLVAATRFVFDRMTTGMDVYHYVDRPVMTTRYLVDAIHDELSRPRPRWSLPPWLARSVGTAADVTASLLGVDLPITGARIEKFCTPTNFSALAIRERGFRQPVPNAEAVARTVRWHMARDRA